MRHRVGGVECRGALCGSQAASSSRQAVATRRCGTLRPFGHVSLTDFAPRNSSCRPHRPALPPPSCSAPRRCNWLPCPQRGPVCDLPRDEPCPNRAAADTKLPVGKCRMRRPVNRHVKDGRFDMNVIVSSPLSLAMPRAWLLGLHNTRIVAQAKYSWARTSNLDGPYAPLFANTCSCYAPNVHCGADGSQTLVGSTGSPFGGVSWLTTSSTNLGEHASRASTEQLACLSHPPRWLLGRPTELLPHHAQVFCAQVAETLAIVTTTTTAYPASTARAHRACCSCGGSWSGHGYIH